MKTSLRTLVFAAHSWVALLIFLFFSCQVFGQATVSNPIAVGRQTCTSGGSGMMTFNYNSATNTLTNSGAMCTPTLGTPGFSRNLAGDAFNPADQRLYYQRTIYSSGIPTTYVWRWDPRVCLGGSPAPLKTYPNIDIAGLVFDRNGLGYWIEFTNATAPYNAWLKRVDFQMDTFGVARPIRLTGGKRIYQLFGDVALTPSGTMMFSFDNKLFTLDFQNYGLVDSLTGTFVDTVRAPVGAQLVGLTYAGGDLIAGYSGGGCPYKEVNILTGDTTGVTYGGGGTFSTFDFTSITSGLGLAKKLVQVDPTGTPGTYNLTYDILVRNYGNVPDSNVQVTDNLGAVFGAGNVSVILKSVIGAPPGIAINPSYNGTTVTTLLTGANRVLPCFPVSQSSFTIRIYVQVANIIPGVVYNNNATGTCTGYRAVSLTDVSTDGDVPDLNTNDKCDDTGEDQPTPFIISVAAETPPCAALNTILYNQTFGAGTGLTTTMPGTARTAYTPDAIAPVGLESYVLTDNAGNGDPSKWISLTDRTGNPNGRMLVVNADVLANKIFVDTVNIACDSLKYSFFAYAAFIGNSGSYQTLCNGFGGYKYPKLVFTVRNAANGRIITNINTALITSTSWNQYGMKFIMPSGVSRVIIEIYNAGEGGCGNDLALDDIQFGLCDPTPTVTAGAITDGCVGGSTTMTATLSDPTVILGTVGYQWQYSPDNTSWSNITGATSATHTIGFMLPGNAGYYRVLVAPRGDINNAACRYTSNSFQLTLKTASLPAATARASKGNVCPGDPVTLGATGILGTGAQWRWFTGSCGGTLIGTGATITVNPMVTTTYYVLAQGDCNTTTCRTVTVTVTCDIDDDDDGIPDLVENNGTDVEGDTDVDGILDWRDSDFPGFVDANSDGVNDNFDRDQDGIVNQYDLDSDNDGIPDTVESGGVDTNGDGRIDNYSDTDADGFSQNVDANSTGKNSSGNGLDRIDLDSDGVPNFLDTDSDNDGIPDLREAGLADTNNDGKVDGFTDTDGDGYTDSRDGDVGNDGTAENAANTVARTGADADNNGRADSYPNLNMDRDGRMNPYDLDSDGDGITDVREAGFPDTNNNGFTDNAKGANGWDVVINALATLTIPNTDGTGNPNYLDIDSDDDGITDNVEGMSTTGYFVPAVTDFDNDGVVDTYDVVGGFGANGITPNDQEGDTTPDYLDSDTDNDGQIDRVEGNDFNFNKMPDDLVTLTGIDTDGDGLDDRFDNDNANPRVTCGRMGTGGITAGPSPFGTRSVVQQSWPTATDRDWRYIPYILPAELLSFNGNVAGSFSLLNWEIRTDLDIRVIEVQRSLDGATFEKVGEVPGKTGTIAAYNYNDNIAGINASKIYYRLRIIGVNGRVKMSDVLPLALRKLSKAEVTIVPNPASSQAIVNISLSATADVEVRLLDATGKLVGLYKRSLLAGTSSIRLTGIEKLSSGIYHVQVKWEQEVITQKLFIRK